MKNSVSADSSMYICLAGDLRESKLLSNYLNSYRFFVGSKILNEIKKIMTNNKEFYSKVTILEYDYYELIKPFFFRDESHFEDGEYEAIGIGFHLNNYGMLKYLVIDEKRARNFVQRNFSRLFDKLVGTIGFIRDSCIKDKKISLKRAIEVLSTIQKIVKNSEGKRPCSLDKKNYEKILIPTINLLQREIRD